MLLKQSTYDTNTHSPVQPSIMSFLTSLRANSRRVMQSSSILPSTSSFHTTAARRTLKESDESSCPYIPDTFQPPTSIQDPRTNAMAASADRDDLPNIYEAQKEDQVKSSKEGKAKWKGELATNSEADVWFPFSIFLLGWWIIKTNVLFFSVVTGQG